MSKEAMLDDYLNGVLGQLEDSLAYLSKCNNYQELQNALKKEEPISIKVLDRLLAVCVDDLKHNTQHTVSALSVISAVLAKLKSEEYKDAPLPQLLLVSAVTIINMLRLQADMKTDKLPVLSVEVLLSYPDTTLVDMVKSHSFDLMNMIGACTCKQLLEDKQPINVIDLHVFELLVKLFKILPHEVKERFMKQGLTVWFAKIIPRAIAFTKLSSLDVNTCIELLELLTDSLIHIDYAEDPNWKVVLESICNPLKYPAIMKNHLEIKNDCWYRIWIIFIRLLKNQVTSLQYSSGSPINSMLPVVELAFKLDPKRRCQAFQCWNVLIDNFASELKDSPYFLDKRINLLIVPLKSNNAKVEEIALAKLNTWWHLMRKFHSKMDKFTETVLIPFLHFCFGKLHASGRVIFSPGQFSDNMKKLCLQAFVEIAGHVDCEGCVTLPRLKNKLISAKILVEHWKDWIHSLKTAIIIAAIDDNESSKRQATCLWKSFVLTIGEMQENNIRKDLFNELLAIITQLRETYAMNDRLADISFNVLIGSLFDGENKIRQLFKTKGEEGPIHTILSMILNSSFTNFFSRQDSKQLVSKLKPITNLIMDGSLNSPDDTLKWLFKDMLGNDNTLMLWTALAESICESKHNTTKHNTWTMLLWPLRFLPIYSNEISSIAWKNWLALYNSVHSKLNKTSLDDEISKILSMHQIRHQQSPIELQLCATLAVLKRKLLQDESKGYGILAEILHKIMSEANDYQRIEKMFPILFDTVTLMTEKVLNSMNMTLATQTIDIIMIVLKLITQMFQHNDNESGALIFAENLLKLLDDVFKIETYSSLQLKLVESLVEFLPLIDKHSSSQYKLLSMLKSFLAGKNKLEQSICKEAAIDAIDNSKLDCNDERIQNALSTKTKAAAINTFDISKLEYNDKGIQNSRAAVDAIDNNSIDNNIDRVHNSNIDYKIDNVQNSSGKQNSVKKKLTTPNNGLRKKSVSKETSIVNTVVVNGEDFVVVKSNWKFNPRKLTENQKERLKRKRDDIPALYQDLSQSQDEFKLSAWKTDSQDTTTSSKSTSKSNDAGASVILKNLLSTDVVPKIMENILSHNATKDIKCNEDVTSDKTNKNQQLLPVKDSKSPRMALKDRVFHNVRNLIAKSSVQHDDKLKSEDLNQTVNENVPKTPSSKINVKTNLTNSAPSKITFNRPSRVIKVPRKFDDSELIVMKKRRRSQNSSPQPNMDDSDLILLKERRLSLNCTPQIDFEMPGKPVEDSNVQTKTNKEEDTYLRTINKKSAPVLSNNETQDVRCTMLSNKGMCEDKMLDTQMEITQTMQNNEEDKICPQEKCLDEMDVDGKSIVAQEKEIQENINIDTDDRVEILTPEPKKLHLTNEGLSPSNAKEISTLINKEKATPNPKNKEINDEKSSVKKKRSRIEQQLLIDMVEGHPFLQVKSDKRITRKNVTNEVSECSVRRKSLAEKLAKNQSETKIDKKRKRKEKLGGNTNTQPTSVNVDESQDKLSQFSEDRPMSEDIIESSQDSSVTTISMKSSKHISKKLPLVLLGKVNNIKGPKSKIVTSTQQLLDEFNNDIEPLNSTLSSDQDSKEDIELPENKTREGDKTEVDLTENMETQPLDKDNTGDIIVVNNNESPIVIDSEDTCLEISTQEIAEADTQPLDTKNETILPVQNKETSSSLFKQKYVTYEKPKDENDTTLPPNCKYFEVPAKINRESNGACSPLNDEVQRKKDFLNDTIEISPIKTLSPIREKKSPSPETSSDYVVIKLTSPVQSNGEPFEKCDSPEIFTEDKISPDKRDQSPPRVVVSVQNASPSSSLSLKKNRPQMRPNGRAAHMLGLCAPDKLQAIMTAERSANSDESKKSCNINTAARRNLRILYNSVGENSEQNNSSENEENENFLKLKRSIPTADCSPAGPILKRKLADIVDEVTISPVSKRKRVSFHDPPVSTTVAVHKYIEPGVLRSPQSSTFKRLEKQMRTNIKSAKKLENVFKIDTKAVDSYTEETSVVASIDDTVSSMDQTPAVEVVKTSELNDTDPIYSDLLGCTDPIDNIAGELSSPAMKALFIKELKGKVGTIGDLAKMTELEVNRLCIKAPKVMVAKRVLTDYASKKAMTQCELIIVDESKLDAPETVPETASFKVQTNTVFTKDCEMQTMAVPVMLVHTQTDIIHTSHTIVQTEESGSKSTYDIISTCLSERPDFIDQLSGQLEESSIQRIADNLSINASVDLLMKKMTMSNSFNILNQILEKHTALDSSDKEGGYKKLSFLQAYMSERFNSKDLILFCSQLLQKVHDKPA